MGPAALVVAALAAPPSPPSVLPELEGFSLTAGPTTYGPDNLYEYIDGGADAFLQQDFEELVTGTYESPQKVEVTVDVYRHRDATRAYAMYTQERPGTPRLLPLGVEAYAGGDHLEAVVGAYYVKLTQGGARGPFVLREVAARVIGGLPGTRERPPVIGCFPAAGKVAFSEKLAGRDFLGHAFLHDGAAAAYEVKGARFRLFAVAGRDAADAREMRARYLALAHTAPDERPEGEVTLRDPLNGEVRLRWRGRWLWGAVDGPTSDRGPLLDELGRRLMEAAR